MPRGRTIATWCMRGRDAPGRALAEAVRASGLIEPGSLRAWCWSPAAPTRPARPPGLAARSAPTSVHALARQLRASRRRRRATSAAAATLCAPLRIDLHVERPEPRPRATSRPRRGRSATRPRSGCATRTGADWIATGHTRTDLAETVLYRLAVSPGARALLGLPPRSGRVVRPLLELERERDPRSSPPRPACRSPTTRRNARPAFARNRIRARGAAGAARDRARGASATSPRPSAELAEEARAARAGRRSRRSPRPAPAPARSRSAAAALARLRTRRSGGSPCARSPSAPPGARCRSGARARGRDRAPRRASPRAARSSSAAGVRRDLRARAWSASRAGSRPTPRPRPAALRRARQLPVRALGGARRASPGPGRARRAPTSRRSTPAALGGELEVRDLARRRPDAAARACGGTQDASRTCSPTAGVPRSLRAALPVVTAGGGSPGSPGSRSRRTSGSRRERPRSPCSARATSA